MCSSDWRICILISRGIDSLAAIGHFTSRSLGIPAEEYSVTRGAFSWRLTTSKSFPNSASLMSSFRTITRAPQRERCAVSITSLRHPQAKLCRVVEGEALDVAVDIRLGSPNFGKWTSVLLSAEKQNQIFIPQGFAHGFLALTDTVQFLYKCSDFYDPGSEHGIIWNDPDVAISWGVADPLVSEKDAKLSTLAAMPREFLPHYSPK